MDKTWGSAYSHKCNKFIIIKLWREEQTWINYDLLWRVFNYQPQWGISGNTQKNLKWTKVWVLIRKFPLRSGWDMWWCCHLQSLEYGLALLLFFSLSTWVITDIFASQLRKELIIILKVWFSERTIEKSILELKREVCKAVFSSVHFSRSVMSDSLQPQGLQHARLPCPSPIPGVCSNSCPSSWWWHPTISFSVISGLEGVVGS